MAVGDEFTTDIGFAQRELKQPCHAVGRLASCTRHAVECVRHTTHTALECGLSLCFPAIAMSAAHADAMSMEEFDRFKCSRQFGCDGHTLQHIRVFEQSLHRNRRGLLNELEAL